MGVIYRERQKSVNREVAIKKIKVDVGDTPDIKSKFVSQIFQNLNCEFRIFFLMFT